jgi:uncharacterized repeat protein (TIGR04052 family)
MTEVGRRYLLAGALIVATGCARNAPVTIPFAARFGDQPFTCAAAVDAARSAFVARDLRFYVHGVQLLAADGTAVDVTLRDDGVWQSGGVALLDFEDGTGNCVDGTHGTHTTLAGTVRAGTYTGIRFVVGVPFERNHANPAEAVAPLNLGHMHWGWQAGYKFLRFEGTSNSGSAYRFHLGSTQCEGTIGHITRCRRPNRALIELQQFTPGRTIVLDLNAFLRGIDLAAPTVDGVHSCMSEPDAPDCAAAFAALGLDLQSGRPSTTQRLFSLS